MKNQGKASNSGFVVIVVSDDLAVRNSLKFWLETEGPRRSALNLIAQLRDRHLTAPAILIASHSSLSLRQQAEKAEVPIVEKPLVGNALLDKIRDVVGARG